MAIEIYTQAACPYCTAAIRLLQKRGVSYEEIELTHDPALTKQVEGQTRQTTTPHVFVDGRHIGGFDELVELDQEGKLNGC